MIFDDSLYLWQVVNTLFIDVNDFSVQFQFFSLGFLGKLKIVLPYLFQFLSIFLFPFFFVAFIILFDRVFRRSKPSLDFRLGRLIFPNGKLLIGKIPVEELKFPPLLINDDPVLPLFDLFDLLSQLYLFDFFQGQLVAIHQFLLDFPFLDELLFHFFHDVLLNLGQLFDLPLVLLIDVVDLRLEILEPVELENVLVLNRLPNLPVDG